VERYRDRRRRARDSDDKEALDALDLFRKDVASFIRLYDFLSQIINYGDTDLEKTQRVLHPPVAVALTGERESTH
jgi:type I restriction enzyme R subunit